MPFCEGCCAIALEEEGFVVVAECGGAEDALETVDRIEADVLITNLIVGAPVADGYELTARLRAGHQQLPVVIVTAYDGPDRLTRARAAGASGLLPVGVDLATLTTALRTIAAGGTWFGDEAGAAPSAPG